MAANNSHSLSISVFEEYSKKYDIPIEDSLFIALNYYGVQMDVDYNRMRMAFHLNERNTHFSLAKMKNDLNYYFALPINHNSPFSIIEDRLALQGTIIGDCIGATEDFCDSHYPRRLGTSLNINPNSRTSCRGCDFCYTAYQVPLDKKKMKSKADIEEFFTQWMFESGINDLSQLIQVSVVTGCYDSEEDLVAFLLDLDAVLKTFHFSGRIFYLGSMLSCGDSVKKLKKIDSFGYCLSIECFERRNILRSNKSQLSIREITETLCDYKENGFEVNYTYVIGTESQDVFLHYMKEFIKYTNKFPTINVLQLHQQHNRKLMDASVKDVSFFYDSRKKIESIFLGTNMRPLVWEDYRSLWYLSFSNEPLTGVRYPEYFWKDKLEEIHEH
jgi:hypothetical protein